MTEFDPQTHGSELSAYLDGELDAAECAAVEQLLAASPAARRELELLRAVSSGLRGLSRHAAPDEVLATIRAGNDRGCVPSASTRVERSRARVWRIRSLINTLATAAALGLVWVVGRSYTSSTPMTGDFARTSDKPRPTNPVDSIESLETVGRGMDAIAAAPGLPTVSSAIEAPAISSLSKPSGVPGADEAGDFGEIAGSAGKRFDREILAGRVSGFAGETAIPRSKSPTVCNVVVNTRSAEEYQAIQEWAIDVTRGPAAVQNFRAAIPNDQSPLRSELLQLQLPAAQLEPVLTSLGERVAPGVRIAIAFQPPAVAEAESALTDRQLEPAKPELRAEAGRDAARSAGRGVAAAGYAGSLREDDSDAKIAANAKDEAADVHRVTAEGSAPAPSAAASAAPSAAADRRTRAQDAGSSRDKAGAGGGRGAAGEDQRVDRKPENSDAVREPVRTADAEREERKEQGYKFGANLQTAAPATTGPAPMGAASDADGYPENRPSSRSVQNHRVIQSELNNAIQQQAQDNLPIPLRFAMPQLQNQVAAGTVMVNLIVNRPPAGSQPASSPSR